MKPWREVCVPHPDVLKGTFLQSEFAADITAVNNNKAALEYQNAAAFYERTVITEGMRLLLTQVAQRLNGHGAEPVIQLQTAFGGGKTHTMLAVYHLAKRRVPLEDLAGIPALLERAGLSDVPKANVAVLDGHAHGPGQPWKHERTEIRTLWGELGWGLGKEEGYAFVRESDLSGTSPGKEVLRALLEKFAPCVVLVDELVAYIRQFAEGQSLPGGTYESNLSFVQALTEATKLVPTAILLASLPESEPTETGGGRGASAHKAIAKSLEDAETPQGRASLKALEKTFGRVHALWKPIATEEAFEIVRRRLFEPIQDVGARDDVCRAFYRTYTAEGSKLPSETHEVRYQDRLAQAYPIHPEIFDRLFQDWTTLDGFQRTRGVLKLMARVIHRLWANDNRDLMILPGSLPLDDNACRDELLYYLPPGWNAVVDRDIDGGRAETTEIDSKEPRFGAVMAARRVARTVFLGTAPSSGSTHEGNRGIERARVLLGCLQPGQPSSTFSDALNRLADRLHYLNSSGERTQETTRFWFDTRANLRREMEERKGRFEERGEVRAKVIEALKTLVDRHLFEGVHPLVPSSDVPDDSALRLVFLPLEKAYSKQDPKAAKEAVLEALRPSSGKVRHRANRLVFVAPDEATIPRLLDAVRTALSWASIIDDVEKNRLNIDNLREREAQKRLDDAQKAVPGAVRACFKWVMCPVMDQATDKDVGIEVFPLAGSGGSYSDELARVCQENELVISTWSPIHLREKLRALYWKEGVVAVKAAKVWEDMQRYFYMPRLLRRSVLEQTILQGASTRDFFGTAYGQSGDQLEGFKFGDPNIQVDDTLLLIEPAAATAYETAKKEAEERAASAREAKERPGGKRSSSPAPAPEAGAAAGQGGSPTGGQIGIPFPPGQTAKPKSFIGSVDVSATTAKMKLVSIAEEIIAVLASDPNATVKVTLEIQADFPAGASDQTKRTVSENATALGFKSKLWE